MKHNDDMIVAMIELRGELPLKCKPFKAELQNQCNIGSDLYPIDLNQVMKVLQNCAGTKGALPLRK